MVQVTTAQIRSQAQQAQQQVSRQQQQLSRQQLELGKRQQQLTSAQAVRTLSRQARELQTRQLGSTQQQLRQQTTQLQTASRELERIRALPTAQELLSQSRERLRADLKVARVAIRDKSIAIASLPKNIRDIVQRIREGQSDASIIKRAEESLGQSLSAIDRQAVLDLAKGITPTEIALKVSLPAGLRELPAPTLPKIPIAEVIQIKTSFREAFVNFPGRVKQDFKTFTNLNNRLDEARRKGQPFEFTEEENILLTKLNLRTQFNRFVKKLFFKPLETKLLKEFEKAEVPEESILRKRFFFDPSELALGVVFFPLLQSGAVKKGKAKVVVKQKTKVKEKAKKATEFTERELDVAIKDSFVRDPESIREAYRKALATNNKKLIKRTEKILRQNLGKDANKLIKDIKQQELIKPEISRRKLFKGVPASQLQGAGIELEFAPAVGIPAIPQAGAITGLVAGFRPITPTKPLVEKPLTKAGQFDRRTAQKLSDRGRTLAIEALGTRFRVAQVNALKQQIAQALRQVPKLASPQATRTAQRQRTRQLALLRLRLRTVQKQQAKQRARTILRTRLRFPRGAPIPLPLPELKKKVPTKKVKRVPKAFDVFTFKGGKKTLLSKKPFETRKGARDFGASQISRTLRASFFVSPSNRKGAKKVSPKIKGSFNTLKSQFRPSKNPKRKGVFVEKRKFRLDSRNEVQEIKRFKKVKPLIRMKKK